MRIAYLTATFPPYWGGTGTAAFHNAQVMAARGHSVEVITGSPGADGPDPHGVTVRRLRPVFAIGNAPLLPSLASIRGYDIVHLQHPFIFGSELVLANRARRDFGLCVTYQNRLIGKGVRRPMFWTYEETIGRAVSRVADHNFVLSFDHADSVDYLRSGRARHPDRFSELPNGVDTSEFRPGRDDAGIRARHGIPPGVPVLAFVAALDLAHHFKRVDLALEAVARQARDDVHLLVIGGGELLDSYRDQAQRLGLGTRAVFAGPQPHSELPAYLRACDALVLATEPPESFGIVLVEAMATGLPVVVTDLPGVRTVVTEGATGFLVRQGSVDDLTRAIATVVDMDPARRAATAAAARSRTEELYSWSAMGPKLERVYEEVVVNHSG